MTEAVVGWRRYALEATGPDTTGIRAVTPVPDQGLRIEVDGRPVTAADDLRLIDLRRGTRRLSWRLEGQGVAVDVTAEAAGPVVRTETTVSGRGRVTRVDVERWAPSPGLGQPSFGDGWFAGLAHPGAEDLGLAVDHDLATDGPLVLPSLVVGATAPGEELSGFWDELDRVRASPARLIVLANNWYQLGYVGRMDAASVSAELAGFGDVAARHGLRFDWYCLDDPWDGAWEPATGLWGRMAPDRFPGGLAPVQEAARGRVGGIGLWVSPWGGYFDRHDFRVAWGREHGFEVQDGSWPRLCPAGDRYSQHLAEALTHLTAAGVGYWKLDGVQFDCPETGHGHPVDGVGSGRTAQMDRFAALLDGVRAARPGTILAFTTGSNPSPWWLRHADFLWRGGLDDDAPAQHDGGRHERFATYIDGCLDALRHSAVPVSAIVTFSLVENGARAYREEGEGPDAWERHCWLLAGRGTHHHDLYVAPDSLSDREWSVLAEALAWARSNEQVLARSRMVGGRPEAGEPYGFLSAAGDTMILCVRNPSGRGRELSLRGLGGEARDLETVWGRPGAVHAAHAAGPAAAGPAVAGPAAAGPAVAGPALALELEPFEVVVVSGRWRPGTRPGPPG